MVVVIGNIFDESNKEVKEVLDKGVKHYKYHELLRELAFTHNSLAISGCHGKTTTTALISHVFDDIIGANYLIGDGTGHANIVNKYFFFEADEYKRVYNFSRAYPYALFVANVIVRTDSLFEADHYSKRQQENYLNKMKENLLKDFDKKFRNLTLKQGLMMIKLIDREVGMAPYFIIKYYLGSINAVFWQGVAKLFDGDLKKPYDKFGEDADLEELCKKWDSGEFRALYLSIFGTPPLEITVPEKYMKPLS